MDRIDEDMNEMAVKPWTSRAGIIDRPDTLAPADSSQPLLRPAIAAAFFRTVEGAAGTIVTLRGMKEAVLTYGEVLRLSSFSGIMEQSRFESIGEDGVCVLTLIYLNHRPSYVVDQLEKMNFLSPLQVSEARERIMAFERDPEELTLASL